MDDGPPPTPANRHSTAIERLRRSVLEGPGETDPTLRRTVAAYANGRWSGGAGEVEIPEDLRDFIDKVVFGPYKVMDEDIERLRDLGYSEDDVFELSVAAAVGCGLGALRAGLGAIGAECR